MEILFNSLPERKVPGSFREHREVGWQRRQQWVKSSQELWWGSGELLPSHGSTSGVPHREGTLWGPAQAGAAGAVQQLAANHHVPALCPVTDWALPCSAGSTQGCWLELWERPREGQGQGQAMELLPQPHTLACHAGGTERAAAWVAAGKECLKRNSVPPQLVT